ncbi:MAG: carbohydrate ABC transporter permease [Candidatus Bathyarchaeia archaeon]
MVIKVSLFSKIARAVVKILALIFTISLILWFLFPFYWSFVTSFKHPTDWLTSKFIPFVDFSPSLITWERCLKLPETQRALLNNLTISTSTATLALLLGTPAAYSLARFQFRKWKNRDIATFILTLRMIPPAVVIVPFFMLMSSLQLLDSWLGIVLVHTTFALPFAVWIMREFFLDLPKEYEEAALIDGGSYLTAFLRIALPLATPGLIATWIFCQVFSWNEFLFVLILSYSKSITLPWIIASGEHSRGIEWGLISAYTILAIIIPITLAILIRKYLARGLSFGVVR